MERLTRRSLTGTSRYVSAIGSGHGAWPRIIQRLAAYEDTGLEPEEVAPVVHGRWVDRYGGKYDNPIFDCSECGEAALYKSEMDELGTRRFVQALSNVCPNCGAKMDLKED